MPLYITARAKVRRAFAGLELQKKGGLFKVWQGDQKGKGSKGLNVKQC